MPPAPAPARSPGRVIGHFIGRRLRPLLLGAALPLLSGCAALTALGDATEPLDVYEVQAPSDIRPARASLPRDVIVELPTTSGALETDRIMIRPTRLAAAYLPEARWGEAAPVMVQTVLTRTLDATGAFRYVGRRPLGPSGDFAIVTELLAFEALAPEGSDGAQVEVRMVSRILREDGVRVLSTRSFEASDSAASLEAGEIVEAFDRATDRVARDFAEWVLTTLDAPRPASGL
ncbi:MAG: ABC-type transport auxiliary lipoprotein family protein [Roseicyclus sp.]|nr:ABC-type transport auxiliary lipoprotein family protein [Roseicyclus sp.]